VFHRSSFKTQSFAEASWRFPGDAQPPSVYPSGGGGPRRPPRREVKRRRKDTDDDALLFLLR
jgi:hypothetical protein